MISNDYIQSVITDSIETKQRLLATETETIMSTAQVLIQSLKQGGTILFCGNGGSAADCQHIAAELVVRLRGSVERRAIPAIALTTDSSILTACGNDYGYDEVFARSVEAYGKKGDVLVGITTSGNSPNVQKAVEKAKSQGVITIGLLGGNGGKLKNECDHSLIVPSTVTARIQESHILIGHIWCELIEEALFPEKFL
ncbi:MAG: D-sedoheptulose 7-phosphate isomerase [Candidatus Kapabacteria bacterium]|jgi:D-sedoheptulose 7-phosphate isomerase|nr:D-sedoheptulose 7-phosphate isomerase [Candidatus Kapabacteria bacterium]